MVNDFDRDTAGFRFLKGTRGVAVERGPGFFVDFGLEGSLQSAVGIVRAEEVGVADEEALFVVVGIDEPASDAVGAVADDFSGLRFEHIYAMDSDLYLVVSG